MMVRLSGRRDAKIVAPMLVFKNGNCSNPKCGVLDNVNGVCSRSGEKGWMNGIVFEQCLLEKRAI